MQRSSSCAALWMACVLCALSLSHSAAAPGDLPTVRVLRITSVTVTSATLNAAVEFNGSQGGGGFEYGLDTHYGSGVTATLIGETGTTDLTFPITGLTTGSLYHYRAFASNTAGSVYSEDHTFIAGNYPPYAQDDEYTQRNGTGPFELPVVGNDYDLDGTSLHIVSVTQPAHGHVEILPGSTSVSYSLSDAGFAGDDLFSYTIEDAPGDRATGHVVMHVGRLPVVSTVLFASGDGVPLPAKPGDLVLNRPRFASFGIPSCNNGGQVAFTAATIARHGRGSVIVGPSDGASVVLVSSGDRAPGATGALLSATFASFGDVLLNSQGDVAFMARLRGPGVNGRNDRGIWTNEGGTLRLVARAGDPAAGTAAVYKSFRSVALSDRLPSSTSAPTGHAGLAFVAQLASGTEAVSPANDLGLWRYLVAEGATPALQLLVRDGLPIRFSPPNDLPGQTVRSFSAFEPQKGAAGHGFGLVADPHNDPSVDLLVRVNLGGDDDAIAEFRSDPNFPIKLVAGSVQSAGGGTLLDRFGPPTQDATGQNGFVARVREEDFPNAQPPHPAVVYVASDLDTSSSFRVLQQGTEVVDVPGATYASFANVVNNGVGIYAVTATITGPDVRSTNDTGVFLNHYASFHTLAREGTEAPGSGGASFADFLSLAMPANGRPLLKATTQAGRGARRTAGVWFTDDDLALRLALREGDPLPGPKGGRIRSLSVLERVEGSATQTRSFDQTGDFVSRVSFDLGRQAIVKTDIP